MKNLLNFILGHPDFYPVGTMIRHVSWNSNSYYELLEYNPEIQSYKVVNEINHMYNFMISQFEPLSEWIRIK